MEKHKKEYLQPAKLRQVVERFDWCDFISTQRPAK